MCWPICLLAILIFYIQRCPYLNSLPTSRLLITIANSLNPDQARRFVKPRGGARISGKEVQMYKAGFYLLILPHFFNIPMKTKEVFKWTPSGSATGAWSLTRSQLFDTDCTPERVYQKVDFDKIQQMTVKHGKFPSRQRVKTFCILCLRMNKDNAKDDHRWNLFLTLTLL